MKPITKTRLAIVLSRLPSFESPREGLEQYPTDSEIAGEVLWNAAMLGDVKGKRIADLGCGGGVLGLGCLLLGASKVTLVDIDQNALKQAKTNLTKLRSEHLLVKKDDNGSEEGKEVLKEGSAEFVVGDVGLFKEEADVVVMNPPFGTRKKHADREFLDAAMKIAPVIYSFHKSETLPYLKGFLAQKGWRITHAWNFFFPLKAAMAHHRRRIHRIKVSCMRLSKQ